MNTFPPSICRWSKLAPAVGVLALAAFIAAAQAPAPKVAQEVLPPFLEEFKAGSGAKGRALPLFLDDFHANKETPLVAREVAFPSALGQVQGYWVRPEGQERVPAVLVVYDDEAWTAWMRLNVRQLASIGYGVLAVNMSKRRLAAAKATGGSFTDEATLAELSAAVRWLRRRADVLPNRCGIVGWGWSGGQALALASATSVQACVVCDAQVPAEAGLIVGLQGTPVLGIFAGQNKVSQKELPAFRKALAAHQVPCKFHVAADVQAGFMGPPEKKVYAHDAAEDAWVEMYDFLEKYVEDARPPSLTGDALGALKPVATIADIMRAVNEPTGLRGSLSRALEQAPKTDKQWQRIRANAALMADSGAWLQILTPAKGSASHWKEQAKAFTAAAEALVTAADRRDYSAAQRGLMHLAMQCAACHNEHR